MCVQCIKFTERHLAGMTGGADSEYNVQAVCRFMADRGDIFHHGRCIYELSRGFFHKSFKYIIRRPGIIQIAAHGVSSFNLLKIICQKKPYVIVRFIGGIQGQRGMKFRECTSTERMGEMLLWPAGDNDEEGEVVVVKEERDNLKDTALHGRIIAFIKTIDDNQTSRERCVEISRSSGHLGFKGSSEDKRILLNGHRNLLTRPGDVDGDLVDNRRDKEFGVTACGIGTREEEAGEQEFL